MIEYRVRSISLLNLVNDIRSGKLIPDAYFQRNLVWRETHNKEFIDTILKGYPFPQIFISKGKVDIEKMATVSCIVDGQQRTNAITEFINDKFSVNEKFFSQLSDDEKSEFLKYEVAVIELDLDNSDPKVNDIFQRINRTSNSLSTIEKLSSQYSTSEYMFVAKYLTDLVDFIEDEDNSLFKEDPNIPSEFYSWAKKKNAKSFIKLITSKNIFTKRDITRKVNLMYTLNIMSTYIYSFYNRNEKIYEYLDLYVNDFIEKDEVVDCFNQVSDLIIKLKLSAKSYWNNKANFFSLFVSLLRFSKKQNISVIDVDTLSEKLTDFESHVPDDYKLAATESVNNKKERILRDVYISKIIEDSSI
ncbi:DUF262 domain-containing protein [Lonsdalea quercina]|uniref:DUF262 domain-containing protein n=1 Tax=Lonsdalea quercina TaxID=71657 RepID=UPI003975BDBF